MSDSEVPDVESLPNCDPERVVALEKALSDCVKHLKVREIAPEKLSQGNAWWAIEVLVTIENAEELIGKVT